MISSCMGRRLSGKRFAFSIAAAAVIVLKIDAAGKRAFTVKHTQVRTLSFLYERRTSTLPVEG
jgi:hypothetical protein